MAGHQIEQDADALFVRLLKKPAQVPVSPIAGGGLFIIPHIVTRVLKGRIKTGIDPQGIEAEVPDITELLDNPLYITDPVSVSVVK
jgi:hypothetical protein